MTCICFSRLTIFGMLVYNLHDICQIWLLWWKYLAFCCLNWKYHHILEWLMQYIELSIILELLEFYFLENYGIFLRWCMSTSNEKPWSGSLYIRFPYRPEYQFARSEFGDFEAIWTSHKQNEIVRMNFSSLLKLLFHNFICNKVQRLLLPQSIN